MPAASVKRRGRTAVQQMGQQCPGRDLRRRDGLCQLREVAAQGQRLQIRPQAVEQFRRGSFIGVVPLALLIEGPLRIDQLLSAGGVLAALPPDAPGDDGDLAPGPLSAASGSYPPLSSPSPAGPRPLSRCRPARPTRSLLMYGERPPSVLCADPAAGLLVQSGLIQQVHQRFAGEAEALPKPLCVHSADLLPGVVCECCRIFMAGNL